MDRYKITYTEAQAERSDVDAEEVYAKAMSEPGQVITFLASNDDALLQVVTSEVARIEKLNDSGDVVDTVYGEPAPKRSRAR